ncbi:MAG: 2-amino-4-hydroxy-6-hydroxymethyldihydropteridine diphosphokinase [Pseudomonadota bacterium]
MIARHQAGVGLGANAGDKLGQVKAALQSLGACPKIRFLAHSRFYHTEPVGVTDQEWFVNAAASIETDLSPHELLHTLLKIESRLGRVRAEKWGPRSIDLDLLFYGQEVIREEGLFVPHPHLHQRRFVLLPLSEVAPEWRHPILGLTPVEMAALLSESGQEVRPI